MYLRFGLVILCLFSVVISTVVMISGERALAQVELEIQGQLDQQDSDAANIESFPEGTIVFDELESTQTDVMRAQSPAVVLGSESAGPQLVQLRGQSSQHTKFTYDGMDLSEMASPSRSVNWQGLQALPTDSIFVNESPSLGGASTLGGHVELSSPRGDQENWFRFSQSISSSHLGLQWVDEGPSSALLTRVQLMEDSLNQLNSTPKGTNSNPEVDNSNSGQLFMSYQLDLNPQHQMRTSFFYQGSQKDIDDFSLSGELVEDPNYKLMTNRWGLNWISEIYSPNYSEAELYRASVYSVDRYSRDRDSGREETTNFRNDRFAGVRVEAEGKKQWSPQWTTSMHVQNESGEFKQNNTDNKSKYKGDLTEATLGVANLQKWGATQSLKSQLRADSDRNTWFPGYGMQYRTAINSRWAWDVSYARKSQRPSLVQIYDPESGNLDLKSEISDTYRTELIHSQKTDRYKASLFQNEYKDLIDFEWLENNKFRSMNVSRSQTQGVGLEYVHTAQWVKTQVYLQKLWVNGGFSTPPLTYRPTNTIQLSSEYVSTGNHRYSAALTWSKDYWAYKGSDRIFVDAPYVEGWVQWSYQWQPEIRTMVRLRNPLDQRESFVPGYGRRAREVMAQLEVSQW